MAIKLRRMTWVGHVARMRAMRNLRRFLLGKHGGGDVTEHLGVDGKIILK
jgi:hypothetical protein